MKAEEMAGNHDGFAGYREGEDFLNEYDHYQEFHLVLIVQNASE